MDLAGLAGTEYLERDPLKEVKEEYKRVIYRTATTALAALTFFTATNIPHISPNLRINTAYAQETKTQHHKKYIDIEDIVPNLEVWKEKAWERYKRLIKKTYGEDVTAKELGFILYLSQQGGGEIFEKVVKELDRAERYEEGEVGIVSSIEEGKAHYGIDIISGPDNEALILLEIRKYNKEKGELELYVGMGFASKDALHSEEKIITIKLKNN